MIHDVVDGFGGCAFGEGGLHVHHLVGNDPEGPPVTLRAVACLPSAERGQDLGGQEVLGTSGKLGRANLSTGEGCEPIISQSQTHRSLAPLLPVTGLRKHDS